MPAVDAVKLNWASKYFGRKVKIPFMYTPEMQISSAVRASHQHTHNTSHVTKRYMYIWTVAQTFCSAGQTDEHKGWVEQQVFQRSREFPQTAQTTGWWDLELNTSVGFRHLLLLEVVPTCRRKHTHASDDWKNHETAFVQRNLYVHVHVYEHDGISSLKK